MKKGKKQNQTTIIIGVIIIIVFMFIISQNPQTIRTQTTQPSYITPTQPEPSYITPTQPVQENKFMEDFISCTNNCYLTESHSIIDLAFCRKNNCYGYIYGPCGCSSGDIQCARNCFITGKIKDSRADCLFDCIEPSCILTCTNLDKNLNIDQVSQDECERVSQSYLLGDVVRFYFTPSCADNTQKVDWNKISSYKESNRWIFRYTLTSSCTIFNGGDFWTKSGIVEISVNVGKLPNLYKIQYT